MRDASDKLCVEYGFSEVVPKSKKVKGMSTAEYHAAEKGQSWKLDLAMAIDEAMRYAVSKEHFIELMEMEGYEVKWKDTHKYITYTCPNGKACRDNKLHEEKYLKENMEDEFRIRKEIIARVEGSGTEKSGCGKADRAFRLRPGEVMDGDDTAATDTNQNAQFDSRIAENTGNVARPLGYAGGTADAADGSRRTDGADTDSVSGDTSITGGTDSDGETQLEADDYGFAYPDDLSDNLGIDSAYLASDVMNILDNDRHTEDCTTMNQPPNNMKNTQSGGYNMSM